MEIRQLRYFVNAAKTLNFTEAARLSNITQSTLSQQIKQLETELQVLLFHRLGKHIQLTAEGKLFLEDAQKILEDERQSLQRLADLNQLQGGTINIGEGKFDKIFAIELDKNHIHFLIEFSPKYSISQIVKLFKQISLYEIWNKHENY